MKYYISILIIIILGSYLALSRENNDNRILNLLQKNSKFLPTANFGIFVISETGCSACNNQYLKFVLENQVNKKNNIIYSAASGMILDISPFLNDNINNLIEGNQIDLDKNHLSGGSYFINVTKNKM